MKDNRMSEINFDEQIENVRIEISILRNSVRREISRLDVELCCHSENFKKNNEYVLKELEEIRSMAIKMEQENLKKQENLKNQEDLKIKNIPENNPNYKIIILMNIIIILVSVLVVFLNYPTNPTNPTNLTNIIHREMAY